MDMEGAPTIKHACFQLNADGGAFICKRLQQNIESDKTLSKQERRDKVREKETLLMQSRKILAANGECLISFVTAEKNRSVGQNGKFFSIATRCHHCLLSSCETGHIETAILYLNGSLTDQQEEMIRTHLRVP